MLPDAASDGAADVVPEGVVDGVVDVVVDGVVVAVAGVVVTGPPLPSVVQAATPAQRTTAAPPVTSRTTPRAPRRRLTRPCNHAPPVGVPATYRSGARAHATFGAKRGTLRGEFRGVTRLGRVTRVGLVGYGGAGRTFHAPLLGRAGLDVAAVVTANPQRVQQVAEDLPDARVVPDLDALLSDGGLDLVVLASPTGAHVAQALDVVAAGLPAVVDKPLGVDASSALEAVDAAAREGIPLTVFQNRRYDPEFRTLAQILSDGLVGEVVRAELRWERWRPVPKQRWRENAPPEEGGGLLLDLFPHLVDQAHVLFGPVEAVYAELFAYTTVGEDTAFLSCRHTSGVVSHLGSTSLAAAPGPWLRLLGREGAYVVGSVDDEPTAFREWQPADASHLGWLVRGEGDPEAVARVPGDQADFYREVARALGESDPQAAMPVDPRDAVHALAVIDAARTSATSGRVVEVVTPGQAP